MVLNTGMDTKTQLQADQAIIEQQGGPTALAKLLGYDTAGGAQRVQNWMRRGIPSKVKVDFPEIFMRPAGEKAKRTQPATAPP